MSKIVVPAHSRAEIERYALHIKQCFGLHNNLYIPVIDIVEKAIPRIDETFSFCILENDDNKLAYNEYAKYYPDRNELLIKESVYIAACEGDGRHRFTVSHELGHYFMHKNAVSLARHSDSIEVPRFMDPEWQANVFAGALLINSNRIKDMPPEKIAQKCGVSYQAATIAINQLNKAKRAQCYQH